MAFDPATGSAAGIAIEPGNHVREYIFDVVIRLAGSIYTGAHTFPGSQIAGDAGHNANSATSCSCRGSIVDYVWTLWTDWPLPQSARDYNPFYNGGSGDGADVCFVTLFH